MIEILFKTEFEGAIYARKICFESEELLENRVLIEEKIDAMIENLNSMLNTESGRQKLRDMKVLS